MIFQVGERTTGLGGYPTIFYIQVADVAEAIAKAVRPGG